MAIPAPEEADLLASKMDLLQRRLGMPVHSRLAPFNEWATSDTIRHFAEGYGDDNPLFCVPSYAESSVWGVGIAPPLFPMSAGVAEEVALSPAEAEAMSGGDPLRGFHEVMIGDRWLLCRPVVAGTRLLRRRALQSAELKTSRQGSAFIEATDRIVYRDEEGVVYAVNDRRYHRRPRHERTDAGEKAQSGDDKTSKASRTPQVYSPEMIDAIDAAYANEQVRGALVRPFDSVRPGDALSEIVKGPLTVTDIIGFHTGFGWGSYGGGVSKIAAKNRQRVRGFYSDNAAGIPDTAQRCHWEIEWAHRLGQPMAYDYAGLRTNWLVHVLTNWMGDAGWLWKIEARMRGFNYLGDTHTLRGSVTTVTRDALSGVVEVALEGVNQLGQTTCTATASVVLPTSESERVVVPTSAGADVQLASRER
jgi:acyl dehydratase